MLIVLVGNTRSGRGRAKRLFGTFRAALDRAGFRVTTLALGDPGFSDSDAEVRRFDPARFRGADAVVACGGDGTVNAVAGVASATGTPIYHVPTGNENLFARAFGMDARPATLIRALQTRAVRSADTAECDGQRFLIMAGFGPDAGVIRRLHAMRTRALGHLAYIEPCLREAARPTLQPLTVAVDGKTLVHARTGWLVVGNIREYASGINFASRAAPDSGTLDAVFMPATNLRDCVNWMLRARLRQHRRDHRHVSAQGTHVEVRSEDGPLTRQIDGEWPHANAEGRSVDVAIRPRALPVLKP